MAHSENSFRTKRRLTGKMLIATDVPGQGPWVAPDGRVCQAVSRRVGDMSGACRGVSVQERGPVPFDGLGQRAPRSEARGFARGADGDSAPASAGAVRARRVAAALPGRIVHGRLPTSRRGPASGWGPFTAMRPEDGLAKAELVEFGSVRLRPEQGCRSQSSAYSVTAPVAVPSGCMTCPDGSGWYR
jgi:hypothetical protein